VDVAEMLMKLAAGDIVPADMPAMPRRENNTIQSNVSVGSRAPHLVEPRWDSAPMQTRENNAVQSKRNRYAKKAKAQPEFCVTKEQHVAADRNMDELLALVEEEETVQAKRANKTKRKNQRQAEHKDKVHAQSGLAEVAETVNSTPGIELGISVGEQLEQHAVEIPEACVQQLEQLEQQEVDQPDDQTEQFEEEESGKKQERDEAVLLMKLEQLEQPEEEKPDDQTEQIEEEETGKKQERFEAFLPMKHGDTTASPTAQGQQPAKQECTLKDTDTTAPVATRLHEHELQPGTSKLPPRIVEEEAQLQTTATNAPDIVQKQEGSIPLSRYLLLQCGAVSNIAEAEGKGAKNVIVKEQCSRGRKEGKGKGTHLLPHVEVYRAAGRVERLPSTFSEETSAMSSDSENSFQSFSSSLSEDSFGGSVGLAFSSSLSEESSGGSVGSATEVLDIAGLQDFLRKVQASIAFPPGLVAPPGLQSPQLELEVKIGGTSLASCIVKISA